MNRNNKVRPIFDSIARNDKVALSRLFSEGFDSNEKDPDGRNLLMEAVLLNKFEIVRFLIDCKVNLDAQDNEGFSALHFAAQDFRIEAAAALIRNGAQINITDRYGNTPLWRATFNSQGRGEMIKLLLENGADPQIKNNAGNTPLDLANKIANFNVKQYFY